MCIMACILMLFYVNFVYMQIFFPLLTNGYYFVVYFNFLAKKVEIIHSVSHNNVENNDVLVGVSLLVIFSVFAFSPFYVFLII